ncbi:MAG: hypothetical protein VSS75_027755 [Candidatus Parabeggiatoa sp.]|nr:hypothetical protein [Candidatus Parabeggiatoa sp.]
MLRVSRHRVEMIIVFVETRCFASLGIAFLGINTAETRGIAFLR